MLKSYVGIVTRIGLEAFLPENEWTARALLSRAYCRRKEQAVCWWAVLTDTAAAEILSHIEQGDRLAALATLDETATQLGPILPADWPAIRDVEPLRVR